MSDLAIDSKLFALATGFAIGAGAAVWTLVWLGGMVVDATRVLRKTHETRTTRTID